MFDPLEEEKIQTICEFLFFDQFKDNATFPRFEQCFQPLFNNVDISMDKVFKEIVGEKKKYVTYKRFSKAYYNYLNSRRGGGVSQDLKIFFDKLFHSILTDVNSFIGKTREKCFNYTTSISCGRRQFITLIEVLATKDGKIHGLNFQYDGVFKCRMYPLKLEPKLNICLEMGLGIVDEKPILDNKIGKLFGLKEKNYRDAVTHVFGTLDKETGIITFLGFKCLSGKTQFVGFPKGDGFIFGKFGFKLHDIKMQMTLDGITKIETIFEENPRKNFFLSKLFGTINLRDLQRDEVIKEEAKLSTLNDAVTLDKLITTAIIPDDHFFNKKLDDDIKGNDYKEVVNQIPREWIRKSLAGPKNTQKKLATLQDALNGYNQELLKGTIYVPKDNKDNKKRKLTGAKGGAKVNANNNLLHKTKKIAKDQLRQSIHSDLFGKITQATVGKILNSKGNYKELKERLGKSIYQQIDEKSGGNEDMRRTLIGQIIPDPSRPNQMTSGLRSIPQNQRNLKKSTLRLSTKNLKGETKVYGEDNEKVNLRAGGRGANMGKPSGNVFFSDAMQFFNDFSQDDNDFFGGGGIGGIYGGFGNFGFNNPFNNYNNYNKGYYNNWGYGGNNYNFNPYYPNNNVVNPPAPKKPEVKYDPVKVKKAQENWKYFSDLARKFSGVYLLQTIGSIIKAINVLKLEEEGKSYVSLGEKIKIYKLLEENDAIINFLTQERESPNPNEPKDNYYDDDDEDEYEEVIIPNKNPEKITSLDELEENIKNIKKLLQGRISPEDKKKLEKLYNLFLQQKNILIENQSKKAQQEMVNENKIDINKYVREEEEKRKKAKEEEDKRMEQLDQSTIVTKEKIVSILNIKTPNKIYKNQEMPKGSSDWTDPLFKPEKKTLCPFDSKGWVLPEDVWESDVSGWQILNWARAEEILDTKDYKVFEEGATVNDILQGSIGDCYFLSVIGSLCKYKKLIDKLFYTKEKTKEHVYGMYIFINGQWELVLVDDYFPYTGRSFKQFAFGSSSGNELWVALLEKAWAKVNGCYAKIGCGGTPNEVFDVLTEAFSERKSVSKSNKEEIWKKMIESEQKNYVMTAGTSGDVTNLDIEEVGLAPGHAYTVLGALEISTSKGKERVVRLRNPWGNGEFNGAWSDSSSKWTDELKKKYGFSKKNDGDFHMAFDDFVKYYVTMGFSHLHEDFTTTVLRVEKEKAIKCQLIKAVVQKNNVHVYFQLYEKNPRIILNNGKYQKTALCFLTLLDQNYKFIRSVSDDEMHICVEETLNKGTYYLLCDVNYRYVNTDGTNHGYNVTAYSSDPIFLDNVTGRKDVSEAIEKGMLSYCKKATSPSKDSNGINIYVAKNYNREIPFMVVAYENPTSKNYKVTLKLTGRGNRSYALYGDRDEGEDATEVVKELPSGDAVAISVLKFTLSSMISVSYSISASSGGAKKPDTKPVKPSQPKDNEPKKGNSSSDYYNPVFWEAGEEIDENGNLLQYVKETSNGYTIGIENKGSRTEKLKLLLTGLDFTNPIYQGNKAPVFSLMGGERKVFDTIIKSRYGELSFQFEYA